MNFVFVNPLEATKKLRREVILEDDYINFKQCLVRLLNNINLNESEEHLKAPLSEFLKNTFYSKNKINTKGSIDLAIYNEEQTEDVAVLIELKKPSNTGEMISKENMNKKALQEAISYYLSERNEFNNTNIKNIIVTNVFDWYIFDANDFESYFNKTSLKNEYKKWKSGQSSGSKTDFLYTDIIAKFIDQSENNLTVIYFNLKEYVGYSGNEEPKIYSLCKVLSPYVLLKAPFINDSNSLNDSFYKELLYILGLEEIKEDGKFVIRRSREKLHGAIIENTITTIKTSGRFEFDDETPEQNDARLFEISLELTIMWINRILFLKLLESQLFRYNNGNDEFKFLNSKNITDYDELNELFFEVLAVKEENRAAFVISKFKNIPYLNSSLFEQSDLEKTYIFINALKDRFEIPVYKYTVLETEQNIKKTGNLKTLDYLFNFLNSYDFASEGVEQVKKSQKTLINASVLGLIFEKINGYQDGSFFTPGFITMYICRETIRNAVIQKFNDVKNWNCKNFDDLYDKIDDKKEANDIVNSIKICDPAVGSGHFLVSALNEMIAVKADLGILVGRNGRLIRDYKIEIINDEVIVTNNHTEDIFEYHLNDKGNPIDELQNLQETLFHEKQTIIENCLFGVDINPNSVNICRLRLWIELLKNAYYKRNVETGLRPVSTKNGNVETVETGLRPVSTIHKLETLPNIDINIKRGNSLLSRFDLQDTTKFVKNTAIINSYKLAVATYRNAENKTQKREMEKLIANIKSNFKTEISQNDPKLKKLTAINGELFNLTQNGLFDMGKKEKAEWEKKVKKLTEEATKLGNEIEELKNSKIYDLAFEWRFEFPEVLDDDGKFVGFDIVIGNPPYIQLQKNGGKLGEMLQRMNYKTFEKTGDIYSLFYEKGMYILRENGVLTLITSNKWMRAGYGEKLRTFFTNYQPQVLIDLGPGVFDAATVDTNILIVKKCDPKTVETGLRPVSKKIDNVETVETGLRPVSKKNENTETVETGLRPVSKKNENTETVETGLRPVSTNDKQFNLRAVTIKDKIKTTAEIDAYFKNNAVVISNLTKDAWTISGDAEMKLKEKIERIGTPLKDWDVKIYRGVLTGFNDAFIIDGKKKDELIAADPKSAEIIKPILRGRDIKRYKAEFADLWLINAHNGVKDKNIKRIDVNDYPAIKTHLEDIENRRQNGEFGDTAKKAKGLFNRDDQGDTPYNLRNCAYIEEFEKEKIVYNDICQTLTFSIVEKGMYFNNTAYFIANNKDMNFVEAILNARIIDWYYRTLSVQLGDKAIRMFSIYVEKIPIPKISEDEQKPFIDLVDIILKKKETNEDTTQEERQIDMMVYKLYELTNEEIRMVEGR